MTEIDRDIGYALLKRLKQRGLLTEEEYISASNSRFFDAKNFTRYDEDDKIKVLGEVIRHGND